MLNRSRGFGLGFSVEAVLRLFGERYRFLLGLLKPKNPVLEHNNI